MKLPRLKYPSIYLKPNEIPWNILEFLDISLIILKYIEIFLKSFDIPEVFLNFHFNPSKHHIKPLKSLEVSLKSPIETFLRTPEAFLKLPEIFWNRLKPLKIIWNSPEFCWNPFKSPGSSFHCTLGETIWHALEPLEISFKTCDAVLWCPKNRSETSSTIIRGRPLFLNSLGTLLKP